MNNSELERKLKAARVPEWAEEYWDAFPRRVMSQLKRSSPRRVAGRYWMPRLAWASGVLVCLGVALGIAHRSRSDKADTSLALLQNEKVVREVLSLFPNRVRAIVQDEHGLQLVLSDRPDVPTSPPLWIKFCDGRHCRAAVTFSGQELQIDGEKVQVLADARGGVMLVGNRLFWQSAEPNRVPQNLRFQARPLSYAL
jgi:hypothetical protein